MLLSSVQHSILRKILLLLSSVQHFHSQIKIAVPSGVQHFLYQAQIAIAIRRAALSFSVTDRVAITH